MESSLEVSSDNEILSEEDNSSLQQSSEEDIWVKENSNYF